jgi:hypothetical protein
MKELDFSWLFTVLTGIALVSTLTKQPLLFFSHMIQLALSVAAYGIYNIFLHPCAKFPGPTLWAAYRTPYVATAVKGVLPRKLLELHRKYGPVVRIAPNELSFTDAQAWHDIQGMQGDRRQNPKEKCIYGPASPGWEGQIIMASDEQHARL